jgi:hypothetical protein
MGNTGTVPPEVYRQRKSYEDVKDHGAKGDGSDDTARILAAKNAAQASGSRALYFPAGNFRTNEITFADGAGWTIFGLGRNRTTVRSLAGGNTVLNFTTTAPDDLHIHGLNLVGAGAAVGNANACGIRISGAGIPRCVHMHDLRISDFRRHGIALGSLTPAGGGADDAVIRNVNWSSSFHDIELLSTGDHMIYAQSWGPTIALENITFWYPPLAGSAYPAGPSVDGRGYCLYIISGQVSMKCVNGQTNGTGSAGEVDTGGGYAYFGPGCSVVMDTCNIEQWDGKAVIIDGCQAFMNKITWHVGRTVGNQYVALYIRNSPDQTILVDPRFTFGGVGATFKNGCAIHSPDFLQLQVFGRRTDGPDTLGAGKYWSESDNKAYDVSQIRTEQLVGHVAQVFDRTRVKWQEQLNLNDPNSVGASQVMQIAVDNGMPPTMPNGLAPANGDRILYRSVAPTGFVGEVKCNDGVVRKFGQVEQPGAGATPIAPTALTGLQGFYNFADVSSLAVNVDGTGGPPAADGLIGWAKNLAFPGAGGPLISQATKATWKTNILNGRSVARFAAVNWYLSTLTMPPQATIFAVYTGLAGANSALWGGPGFHDPYYGAASFWPDGSVDDLIFTGGKTFANSKVFIAAMDYTAEIYRVYLDSALNVSSAVARTSGANPMRFGDTYSGAVRLTADVVMCGWYNRLLSQNEALSLAAWLTANEAGI